MMYNDAFGKHVYIDYHDDYVRKVRAVGESLIKNAESIVGTEKYLSSFTIYISFNQDEAPSINVSRDFYPEKIFELDKDDSDD